MCVFTFLQQGLFLGRHHKVVCLVLVVDDVFEGDALGLVQVVEELLVEDEGDAGDLLDVALRLRVAVDEVDRDGDRQLAAELLPTEALNE